MDPKKNLKTNKANQRFYRSFEIDEVKKDSRTIEISFSSEEPYLRWYSDFGEMFEAYEVLDHNKNSVDMGWIGSGRAPLCAEHQHHQQIGVIETANLTADRRGKATVRFGKGKLADEYFQDVIDGIRQNVSVGYEVLSMILEKEGEGKTPVYRVDSWKPLEISIVSIPADETVGVGRSKENTPEINNLIKNKENIMDPKKREKTVEDLEKELEEVNQKLGDYEAEDEKKKKEDEQEELQKSRTVINEKREQVKQANLREITALGKKHGFTEDALQFISDGKSAREFSKFLLEKLGTGQKPISAKAGDQSIGLTQKEARNFSFLKLIRSMDPQSKEKAEFEREVCQATLKQFKERDFNGLPIPSDILFQPIGERNKNFKRTMNVENNSEGGYLVDEQLMGSSFIELLVNAMKVKQLGATVFTGLQGDVAFPKETDDADAQWLTTGEEADETDAGFGQIAMKPKTVSKRMAIHRKLLFQSSLDVELYVRNAIAKRIALAADKAALKGSGIGAEPLGILNKDGIQSVSISTGEPNFANIVELETKVASGNADFGQLAYLMGATDRGYLKTKEKAANTAQFVFTNVAGQPGVGEVNGYYAHVTNQLVQDEIVFGNWADLFIGEWSILDLLVDPYTRSSKGEVVITGFADLDVAVARDESFAFTAS